MTNFWFLFRCLGYVPICFPFNYPVSNAARSARNLHGLSMFSRIRSRTLHWSHMDISLWILSLNVSFLSPHVLPSQSACFLKPFAFNLSSSKTFDFRLQRLTSTPSATLVLHSSALILSLIGSAQPISSSPFRTLSRLMNSLAHARPPSSPQRPHTHAMVRLLLPAEGRSVTSPAPRRTEACYPTHGPSIGGPKS